MGRNVISKIHDILNARFIEILDNGGLPKVQWSRSGNFKSYSMFEYSENWAKFARIVHNRMKEQGVDPQGVWTRKYNKVLLDKIREIAYNVTEDEILNATERFKTWFDGFM